MAAVRTLCENGVVLDNGEIAFRGSINDAVSFYLNDSAKSTDGDKITDHIQNKKSFIDIENILINGTCFSETTIQTNQKTIEVRVTGAISVPVKMDLKMVFRSLDGQPLATFSNPIYNTDARKFEKGDFDIFYEIELPRFIGEGDIIVDLNLFEPRTQDFLVANGCARLHFEGNMNEFFRPIRMKDEGFLGLTANKE